MPTVRAAYCVRPRALEQRGIIMGLHHKRSIIDGLRMLGVGSSLGFVSVLACSPVVAQDACDLNGVVQTTGGLGTDSLKCGDLSGGTIVTSDYSTWIGMRQKKDGNSLTLLGAYATGTTGTFNFLGVFPLPTEAGATALGAFAIAAGSGSVAVGDRATVGTYTLSGGSASIQSRATNGTAIGSSSIASANNATAVGALSSASGESSTAIGEAASAIATGSVAIGAGSVADQANTVSVGDVGSERRIVNVAAGTAATDAVNVSQLSAATAGVSSTVTTLQTTVTANTTAITNVQADLAATNDALADAEGRLDALEAVTANLDERFDDVENRSDAGTATAVALSGAMFLPGKSFNLTGNIGAYRGAVAGAIQFGALVSESVAVNAGVAQGLNKGGKTALRAGFSFGW